MCGIAGFINRDDRPANAALLQDMIGILAHRGPDETGLHCEANVGLAHARLSIIDVACGQQPMSNRDRSIWITFNGEIFNYVELREELTRKGYKFATRSDTEVLLHLYEEEGTNCVHRLNGQWAFAIWDSQARRLFLSRDRMGIRPLFYTQTNEDFVFASEIKALFVHPGVRKELDREALSQIFTFWVTLPPRTMFKDVFELPPGCNLTVQNGCIRVWPYWDMTYAQEDRNDSVASDRQKAEELLDLLGDATRIRLRADVPVGAYLSGGLDSAVITALARKHHPNQLHTFSVKFADAEFDESVYQREASAFLGTEHHEAPCTGRDIAEAFPDVVWHAEKPVLRTAPAPMFLLSGLVREHGLKVVLTGEGADEVLGGYDIFKEAKVRRFWGAQPNSRMRPLLLRRLYPYLANIHKQSDGYLRSFFRVNPEDLDSPFFSHLPRWELTAHLKMFFSEETRHATETSDSCQELTDLLPDAYCAWPGSCQAEYLESKLLLPGYILSSQGDRAAMAHAVEGRFPFLDHRVVEFASKLPARLKLKVLNEKYLLKFAAKGLVPGSILRRSKQPYRAPDGDAFFDGHPPDYLDELLSNSALKANGIFDAVAVTKLLDKFRARRAVGIKDNMALIGILSTQLLVHQFFDHFSAKGRVLCSPVYVS